MAMEAFVKKSLILAVEEGVNEKGSPIVKRYTFANIKQTATADNLMLAATALTSLYDGPAEFSTAITNVLV